MNALAIQPKTIEIAPAKTAQLAALAWRTNADAFSRKLTIIVNSVTAFQISGAEYDALGQWTDDPIRDLILAKFGLEGTA